MECSKKFLNKITTILCHKNSIIIVKSQQNKIFSSINNLKNVYLLNNETIYELMNI